jgi:hypothetical protein
MKRLLLFPLLLGLLLFNCNKKTAETLCEGFPLESPTLTNEPDYTIFNLIFSEYYPEYKYVNLIQRTDSIGSSNIDYIKWTLADQNIEYDSLMLTDYLEKNNSSYYLSGSLMINPVQLISPLELNCLFNYQDYFWEKYYQKYPESNGYFSFSRPGFNPEGNEAIIEYGWYAGNLAAEGYLVILEKTGSSWKIVHHLITWIS